jgi:hypothetical protein
MWVSSAASPLLQRSLALPGKSRLGGEGCSGYLHPICNASSDRLHHDDVSCVQGLLCEPVLRVQRGEKDNH